MEFCGNSRLTVVITIFVLLGILDSAFATEYVVGGDSGWRGKAHGTASYSQFANITLVVGDTLRFPYPAEVDLVLAHNVFVVSDIDLQRCDGKNPIDAHYEPNAVIKLNRTGRWSFICEALGHCSAGMHLQVTVSGAATPTTQVDAPVPAPMQAPVPASVRPPVPAPTAVSLRARANSGSGSFHDPLGVSPSMSPAASSPKSELSPEGTPPSGAASSSISVQFACLAVMVLLL